MTAADVYELATQGGATDFAHLIRVCESFGPYCLIGGLAVNCYVEPVYTPDAHIAAISATLPALVAQLDEQGSKTEVHAHSINVLGPASQLRIQFTTDERYQAFLPRSVEADVLGIRAKIACLEDVTPGQALGLQRSPAAAEQAQERRTGSYPARGSISTVKISLSPRVARPD